MRRLRVLTAFERKIYVEEKIPDQTIFTAAKSILEAKRCWREGIEFAELKGFIGSREALLKLANLGSMWGVRHAWERCGLIRVDRFPILRNAILWAAQSGRTKMVIQLLTYLKERWPSLWLVKQFPALLVSTAIEGGNVAILHVVLKMVPKPTLTSADMMVRAARRPTSIRALVYLQNKQGVRDLSDPLMRAAIKGGNFLAVRLLYRWEYPNWRYGILCAAKHDELRILKHLVKTCDKQQNRHDSLEHIVRQAILLAPESVPCVLWLKRYMLAKHSV